MAEQLERKHRLKRERLGAKPKHAEQLSAICSHGKAIAINRVAQDKVLCLGCALLNFYGHTEKEEQKHKRGWLKSTQG
jgi:hypothetical protein